MKNKVLYLVSLAILGVSSVKAQLNVGSTSAADASAILQATSTTKGFLPPVMTTTQINAIVSPANGLTVYNSTLSQLQVNVGTPAVPSWSVAAGGANVYWSQLGNTGSVPGTNYLGTTDNSSIGFRTNGVERVRIDSATGNVGIGTTTPYAQLQFANTGVNRKIVLYDNLGNASNDSAFYGFGINSNTLRYQVPSVGNHSFYNNKTLVANINPNGEMTVSGFNPVYNFIDQTRPNNRGAIYLRNGTIGFWHSQYGNVISADSLGNTTLSNKLHINNLPSTTSTATQLLTSDGNGNVGQTTLAVIAPTIYGLPNQSGVSGVTLTSSINPPIFSGWTITIPANSKYMLQCNFQVYNNSNTVQNSSLWVFTSFSTSQTTWTPFYNSGYAISSQGNFASGVIYNNTTQVIVSGTVLVNNPNATPLTLYHFVGSTNNGTSNSNGSASFYSNGNLESGITGTRIN